MTKLYKLSLVLMRISSYLFAPHYLWRRFIALPILASVKKVEPRQLAVSYNLFDGEELLEDSILSIRDVVDHVSVEPPWV